MAVRINLEQKRISLSVGDLVAEPVAAVGRVGGISTWTRLALGREVHANHQQAQAQLHSQYTRELAIKLQTTVSGFAVTIQGRIDGVLPPAEPSAPWVIEEIKSAVLSPLAFAALGQEAHPAYVEQLRLYCYFVSQQQGQRAVGRLVYINAADGERKQFEFDGPFEDCATLIRDRVQLLIDQAQAAAQRKAAQRAAAVDLSFPHPQPRPHQDRMIAAVAQALHTGRHLLVNAPSGIGKTAGALYPAVREALQNGRRVYFVTAKNTQQEIAASTLRQLGAGLAVQLQAREKMCINSVYACREEFCPHLQMFPLKLQRGQVLERLEAQQTVTPPALMLAGQSASLCPFELGLLLAERANVVVCDYNYVFDPQVYFRRFFQEADYSEDVLVIDEAHNLLGRAMDYYSPMLRRRQIHELARNLSHVERSLARDLRRFLGTLDELFESLTRQRGDEYSQVEEEIAGYQSIPTVRVAGQDRKFEIESPRALFESLKPAFTKLTVRYLLDKVMSGRAIPDDPVEEFFAAFGQFCAVLALDGAEFSHVYDATPSHTSVAIVCKDPSKRLAERLNGFHSVIGMSATLSPMEFYRQMLGFASERTDLLSLPSPFPKRNRRIIVVPNILTTYRARGTSYGKIAEVIAITARARRGNYMALFPSFEFLRAVAEELPSEDWEILAQESKMTEDQRRQLLGRLHETGAPKLVLAVQGGLFAEGVDFRGDLLIGVIVVSPALPQVSFERELMRAYYQARHGKGFEYAYLYPGMNRVIQSVGRLIRSETDRGVAVLVCQRFSQAQYANLFPEDWAETVSEQSTNSDLRQALQEFWHRQATAQKGREGG